MSVYIKEIRNQDKSIKLINDFIDESKIVITIIIGKNGSGKSNLLKKICYFQILSYLDENQISIHSYRNDKNLLSQIDINTSISFLMDKKEKIYNVTNLFNINSDDDDNSILIFKENNLIKKNKINAIKKVIAISTSPFDKFPILDRQFYIHSSTMLDKVYRYFGAKLTNNGTKNYLESKLDQLGSSFINFFLGGNSSKVNLTYLFDYLGLKTNLTVLFKIPFPFRLHDENNKKSLDEQRKSILFFKNKNEPEKLTNEEEEIIYKAIEIVKNHLLKIEKNHYQRDFYSINIDVLNNISEPEDFIKNLSIIAKYDLIELSDIVFIKNNGAQFLLSDASSGELCTIFNILAIAGEINDNSIIVIDEPELSLHPNWQYNFIPLIQKVFQRYLGCHFIIATHSPQIISSLNDKNCFIVNMDDGNSTLHDSCEFNKRSSDYQLAEAFGFPGYRNEYLLNEIIEILSFISNGENLNDGIFVRAKKVLSFLAFLEEKDPVYKLLLTLKKALEIVKK